MQELQGYFLSSELNSTSSLSEEKPSLLTHTEECSQKVTDLQKNIQYNNFDETDFVSPANINKTAEANTYVVMEPKPDNPPVVPGKNNFNGKTRTSVFDDSDYDEVIDFIASSKEPINMEQQAEPITIVAAASDRNVEKEPNLSKRSSASESTTSSSTSGVESEEEKTASSTYTNIDIAKILHTKKRIHRILQSSIADTQKTENHTVQVLNNKKKSSGLAKRYTHYGSVGRSKPAADNKRNSRPPSSGGEDIPANGFVTCDIDFDNSYHKPVDQTIKLEKFRHKSMDIEQDDDAADIEKQERKRWSQLSSGSNEKRSPISRKGPWKAFKKFVNNTSSRQLTHEELKATIYIQHNTNQSSNVNRTSFQKDLSSICLSETSKDNVQVSENSSEIGNNSINTSHEIERVPPPKKYTNSLIRRFSRKSSTKRQRERRKSLPIETALAVNGNSSKSYFTSAPAPKPGNHINKDVRNIENMVMASVKNRHDEEEEKKNQKLQKRNSFRKRFLSFSRKRSSSQERKSILKQNTQRPIEANDNSTQISKSLSYSSPQLSIFSVNSASQTGFSQKLDF